MLFILLTFFLTFTSAEHLWVRHWEVTWLNPYDPEQPGHEVPLSIHYPVTRNETLNSELSFPLVVVAHCVFGAGAWYNYVWQSLVPKGFIVVLMDSYQYLNTGTFIDFGYDLRFILDEMHVQNMNVSSPIYKKLDTKAAVVGHSEGGAGAMVAASNYPFSNVSWSYSYDVMMTLSGCSTLKNEFLEDITIPSFLMSGTADCICPHKVYADRYYGLIPNTTCKMLGDVVNATHCNFGEWKVEVEEQTCEFGEDLICKPENIFYDDNIPLVIQHSFVINYMLKFFAATINNGQTNAIDYNKMDMVNKQLSQDYSNNIVNPIAFDCTEK